MATKRVTFLTEDGVEIVADWRAVETSATAWAAILLHMMPADRASWAAFAEQLFRRRIASLAPDLRGHGESIRQGSQTLRYEEFLPEEHQQSIKDVAASHAWLVSQDVPFEGVVLIGASIGANLALQYLALNPRLRAAVLLSPGLDYRGIQTAPLMRELRPHQSILCIASLEDEEASGAVREFDRIANTPHDVLLLNGAAHGTTMLDQDPFLSEKILQWLERVMAN